MCTLEGEKERGESMMQSPAARSRRVMIRPGKGSVFLNADRDVMSCVFDRLPDGYGKSKLSRVCKTLYNRYSDDNAHNRMVRIWKMHTEEDSPYMIPVPKNDWKWVFDTSGRKIYTQFKGEGMTWQERRDANHAWGEAAEIGSDHLNVCVSNVRSELSTVRRNCQVKNYWQASEEERQHARRYKYSQTREHVRCSVGLDEEALVDTWSSNQKYNAYEARDVNDTSHGDQIPRLTTLVTTKLPFLSGKTQEETKMAVLECKLMSVNETGCLVTHDTRMGTVPHFPKVQQSVYERTIDLSYRIKTRMQGPGFSVELEGTLTLETHDPPLRSTRRIIERIDRERKAVSLYNAHRERKGLSGVFPSGNAIGMQDDPETDELNHGQFAAYVKHKLGVRGDEIDIYSDDEGDPPPEYLDIGLADRVGYWDDHLKRGTADPTHSFKSRASIEWSSITYEFLAPRKFASVRVNPPFLSQLVDTHVGATKDGRVRLRIVPLVDKEDSDASDDEGPLARRRRIVAAAARRR